MSKKRRMIQFEIFSLLCHTYERNNFIEWVHRNNQQLKMFTLVKTELCEENSNFLTNKEINIKTVIKQSYLAFTPQV